MLTNLDTLDAEIGRKIAEAIEAGQLKKTQGKPIPVDYAWLQTPPGLRMSFQVLKNAGVPPAEIELFQQRAQLRMQLAAASDEAARSDLQAQLNELEQELAFRLEALRQIGRG